MENSIEEDIERITKLITTKFNNDYSIDNKDKEAIEHILSDYKKLQEEFKQVDHECERLEEKEVRLLKENEELKNKIMEKELEIIGKEEYTKASMGEIIERYYTANEECTPVQKVKDKIEEILNNGEYRIIFEGDAEFPDEATCIDEQKYIKLEKLQELLEESEGSKDGEN